ncbi:hypothetical protein IJQ51_02975 [Candidatus Saccharibacteria bacterium]|nr:hypothetical protein [Candidatus Saccharibacteria bacterium]
MMSENNPPKLARRKENRRSSLKSGRTIPGRREQLEKASERTAAHEKIRKKQTFRLVVTILGILLVFASIIGFGVILSKRESQEDQVSDSPSTTVTYKPTIEIIDEDAISGSMVTSRMKDYIGQAEVDFRALGLVPVKAVIPAGAVREIDFYLDGKTGFVKTTIDRGTGVSTEDAKRMLDYLESQGITDFEYIDVRLEGKAYWK